MPNAQPAVALITMVRSVDFPHAWSCLHPLETQLSEFRHHFLLLNDSRSDPLEARLKGRRHTTLLTPGENLGVACGRNRLMEAALEWGADLVVSLDDDLLVPTDYLDRLVDRIALLEAQGHRVGLVGPAVLDYHNARLHDAETQDVVETGRFEDFSDTETVRSALVREWADDLPFDVVYHMGIERWEEHYMRPGGHRAARLRSVARSVMGTGHSGQAIAGEVRRSDLRSEVLSASAEPISVDTVPGGVCAVSSDVIRDIGLLEEAFSPFGYEDAEYAIRARASGYENFVLPSEILLHDLASRNKAREHGIVLVGLGKARALIARKQSHDARLPVWVAEALLNGMLQVGFTLESRAGGAGVTAGELVTGVLRYVAGLVAGAFRPLSSEGPAYPWSEVEGVYGPTSIQTKSGRLRFDRMVCRTVVVSDDNPDGPPIALDVDVEGVAVGLGGAAVLSGLPPTIKGSIGLTYTMDLSRRRFELSRFDVDVPGLATATVKCVLVGVGPGEPKPELSVADVGCESLSIRVDDRGIVPQIESTVAWAQNLVGDGVLAALSPHGSTGSAQALRAWLTSPRGGTFRFDWHPVAPATIAQLDAQGVGTEAQSDVMNWDAEFIRADQLSVHS